MKIDMYFRSISQLKVGDHYLTDTFDGPFKKTNTNPSENRKVLPIKFKYGKWIQPESGWEISF